MGVECSNDGAFGDDLQLLEEQCRLWSVPAPPWSLLKFNYGPHTFRPIPCYLVSHDLNAMSVKEVSWNSGKGIDWRLQLLGWAQVFCRNCALLSCCLSLDCEDGTANLINARLKRFRHYGTKASLQSWNPLWMVRFAIDNQKSNKPTSKQNGQCLLS